MARITYSTREAEKGAQRHKLNAYQAVGKKAAQVRRQQKHKTLSRGERMKLDHEKNAFEAFMNVDGK